MLRFLLVSCAVIASASPALADHPETMYRDLIRPNGHPRAGAIFNADLDRCYRRTGADRDRADTPAFRRCMLGLGYRWHYTHMIRERAAKTPPDDSWIDPETGDRCHTIKFLGVEGSSCGNF